ncbi:hypothetical protein L1887_48243 [Cichorium endivia]|nr:hypothetical protein L1887_48243 [Cichorium endivia]
MVMFVSWYLPSCELVVALTRQPGAVCTEYVFCDVNEMPSTMSISPPLGQPPAGLVGTVHHAGHTPHPTGMCEASRINTPVVKVSYEETRTDFMYGIGAALDVAAALLVLLDVELEPEIDELVVTAWAPNDPVEELALEDEVDLEDEADDDDEVETARLPAARVEVEELAEVEVDVLEDDVEVTFGVGVGVTVLEVDDEVDEEDDEVVEEDEEEEEDVVLAEEVEVEVEVVEVEVLVDVDEVELLVEVVEVDEVELLVEVVEVDEVELLVEVEEVELLVEVDEVDEVVGFGVVDIEVVVARLDVELVVGLGVVEVVFTDVVAAGLPGEGCRRLGLLDGVKRADDGAFGASAHLDGMDKSTALDIVASSTARGELILTNDSGADDGGSTDVLAGRRAVGDTRSFDAPREEVARRSLELGDTGGGTSVARKAVRKGDGAACASRSASPSGRGLGLFDGVQNTDDSALGAAVHLDGVEKAATVCVFTSCAAGVDLALANSGSAKDRGAADVLTCKGPVRDARAIDAPRVAISGGRLKVGHVALLELFGLSLRRRLRCATSVLSASAVDSLMNGLGDLFFLVVRLGLGLALVAWERGLKRATLALRVLCGARSRSSALTHVASPDGLILLGFKRGDDLEHVVFVVVVIIVTVLAVLVISSTFARSLCVGGALHHRIGSLHVGIARHDVGRVEACGTTASEEGVCGSGGVLQHEQEERRLDDDAQL